MKRALSFLFATSLLVGPALAAPQAKPPAGKKSEAKLQCTLTGKKLEKCCCEQREGKTYCPLAKKTVETCCCKALGEKKDAKPKAK